MGLLYTKIEKEDNDSLKVLLSHKQLVINDTHGRWFINKGQLTRYSDNDDDINGKIFSYISLTDDYNHNIQRYIMNNGSVIKISYKKKDKSIHFNMQGTGVKFIYEHDKYKFE